MFVQAQHGRVTLFDDEGCQVLAQRRVVLCQLNGFANGGRGDGGVAARAVGGYIGVHAGSKAQAGVAGAQDNGLQQMAECLQIEKLVALQLLFPVLPQHAERRIVLVALTTQFGQHQAGVDRVNGRAQPVVFGRHGSSCWFLVLSQYDGYLPLATGGAVLAPAHDGAQKECALKRAPQTQ